MRAVVPWATSADTRRVRRALREISADAARTIRLYLDGIHVPPHVLSPALDELKEALA